MVADSTGNENIDGVIEELENKIYAMQSMIEQLQALAATLGNSPSKAPNGRGASVASFSHDAFFGMTVAEAAKKYLAGIKKTATVNVLSDALIAGGLKSTAKNMPENVRAIISRHTDFVRVNGEFGLAEWYSGRKSGAKKPTAGTSQANVAQENEPTLEEVLGETPIEQQPPSEQ